MTDARVRQRRRLRAAHARPGRRTRSRSSATRAGGPRRRAAGRRDRLRAVVPRSSLLGGERFDRAARERRARARSSTAPGRPRSARSSAPPCRSPPRCRRAWQVGGARRGGRRCCSRRRSPLRGAARRRRRRRVAALAADARLRLTARSGWPTSQAETAEVLAQADPLRHGQPARQRARVPGVAGGYLEDAGLECELDGAEPRAPEPRRAAARASADGPVLGYLSHVDTVLADADGLGARPVGRRGPRRLPVGPRRDRHEVPDRRRGGGRRARSRARAGARARRAEGDLRSSTRRPAAATAPSG